MNQFDDAVKAYLSARFAYSMEMRNKALDACMQLENEHTRNTLQYWIVACNLLREFIGCGSGYESFTIKMSNRMFKDKFKCR